MNQMPAYELGTEVFFMENNRVVSGEVESIRVTLNRISNAQYARNDKEAKVKRPWGHAGIVYAVTVTNNNDTRSVQLGESAMFRTKQALLESL